MGFVPTNCLPLSTPQVSRSGLSAVGASLGEPLPTPASHDHFNHWVHVPGEGIIMRPSSLGGAAYCVALCLSVCLSVCPSVPLSLPSVTSFRQPLASRMYFSARTEGIRTFRHALRAAYRTAISAAQILVSDRIRR